jgi:Flp pilus assembly CpaE family ATPase
LNSAHLQLLLSAQTQISATQSFLEQSIDWLDIEINTLQISFAATLQIKVENMNTLLLALQSGGGNSTIQLSTSETSSLVTVISNITSLLQGYVHSY